MSPSPGYVPFLLTFVGVPIIALVAVLFARGVRLATVLPGVATMVTIALAYTAPWDSYLVARGVWWYGTGTVAHRIAGVPLGEWLFVTLQPVLAGCWFYLLRTTAMPTELSATEPSPSVSTAVETDGDGSTASSSPRPTVRSAGVAVWLALALAGLVLALDGGRTYYLGMILAWAAPVAAFLWLVGGPVVWRARRQVALGIVVPTGYLWLADRLAIGWGLWTISPSHSTGVALLGLPIEEAVFFLLTNALVVQGLVLFEWVVVEVESGGVHDAVARAVLLVRGGNRWR